ncbi:SIMPL domain-containing protein [Erythrobacter sp. F6033]|uniref:SIMPL domain-containing protein n=1 Tax=Erythrobacter sp. F6033 TaxID=2926401 RepID=UPI001FF5E1F2|nr:SIMPL domain-containing protein [Erythrobacter sp. F6033]MCK0128730.1 SIMPL domain-containing protein [Erythrobacter sp. F6033]
MKFFTASAAAALAAMAVSPAAATNVEIEAEGPIIELTVSEQVKTAPDTVTIGAGVTSEARTAVEALRQNSVEMRQVIERIKSLGVDEKDIQTTGINLNARYDYNRNTQQQVFRGYQVSNRVNVKLRDIDETGRVLDALVSAGATDLNGPTFLIDDDTAAKDEARKRAIATAQQRAEAYAEMLGYDGVEVLSISEAISRSGPMPQMMARSGIAEESADASAPVQPGQVSTGVNITITYEMTSDDEE